MSESSSSLDLSDLFDSNDVTSAVFSCSVNISVSSSMREEYWVFVSSGVGVEDVSEL